MDVTLLETTPFDPAATVSWSAVPAPFGAWGFAGDPDVDVSSGGGEDLYLADGPFNSKPADSPANQHYAPVLVQPFNYEVRLFEGTAPDGRASVGFGEILAHNGDGAFDALLSLGWSGRPLMLYRVAAGAARSTAVLKFSGTVDRLVPDETTLSLALRDRQALLDRPLQSTVYAGTGGVEGGSDLAGKPKPLAYGRCFNVPAVLVDSANLVYQVHDGAIAAVEAVRDNGVALVFKQDHPSYAALIAASPQAGAGEYDTCLAEGLVALGAAPAGGVRVDCRGEDDGLSPGGYVEAASEIVRRIVTTRLDSPLSDPADLDTDAFDAVLAAQPAPLGFWQGPDDALTVGQALDAIMASIGGWWTMTLTGLLSVGILTAPTGTAEETLTPDDIVRDRSGALRMEQAVPAWRVRVPWKHNWGPQDPDSLAGSVSAANRQLYAEADRFALATDSAVLNQHPGAREFVALALFALEADATAEAGRLIALHGEPRWELEVGLVRDDPFDAPLGSVVEVAEAARLVLSSSMKFVCIGTTVDLARAETRWTLWG